jgi:hypothetical protein
MMIGSDGFDTWMLASRASESSAVLDSAKSQSTKSRSGFGASSQAAAEFLGLGKQAHAETCFAKYPMNIIQDRTDWRQGPRFETYVAPETFPARTFCVPAIQPPSFPTN